MGFWSYPEAGVGTPSAQWMSELLEAQKNGNMVTDSSRLRLDAGKITKIYSTDTLPGHAAWLEWPWKLHRISNLEGHLDFELYNLESDSMEVENLEEIHPDRISEMKVTLEAWQVSVVRSMNCEAY